MPYVQERIKNKTKKNNYMTNRQIHRDRGIIFVEEEIRSTVAKYYKRILQHPSVLADNLMQPSSRFSRQRRKVPLDLLT